MSAVITSVQPHNEKAAATWSSPGDRYDEISRGLGGAIGHCVNRLRIRGGDDVLDLACGTGWASRAIATLGKDAKIRGVDIAHGLVESARSIAGRLNLAIDYTVGDAERLPYEDASFDAVISSFGIMFASRPDAAAAELSRVTRKGGRFGILAWKPDSTVFQMFKVMQPYLPVPPAPAASPFAWGNRERVEELLGETFEIGFEEGSVPFLAPSAEGAWDLWATIYGPTRVLAANLAADRRDQFRRDMIVFHNRFRTELGILKPREYLLAVGVRR